MSVLGLFTWRPRQANITITISMPLSLSLYLFLNPGPSDHTENKRERTDINGVTLTFFAVNIGEEIW